MGGLERVLMGAAAGCPDVMSDTLLVCWPATAARDVRVARGAVEVASTVSPQNVLLYACRLSTLHAACRSAVSFGQSVCGFSQRRTS